MPLTTMVVDVGAHATGAAVVIGDDAGGPPDVVLIRDPISGAPRWPSHLAADAGMLYAGSAAERIGLSHPRYAVDAGRRALRGEAAIPLGEQELTPVTALSAFLNALHAEAVRVLADRHRGAGPAVIDRLTMIVPSRYPVPDRRRDVLIAAGEAAGFPEVELVGSAPAVLLDIQSAYAFPDGSLVLVCDLGETWSSVLLRVYRNDAVPLAYESANSGRDLDQRLLADLRAQARGWLDARLALAGEDGLRTRAQAMAFVREIKHALGQLDAHAELGGRMAPDAPAYTLRREWLDRLAEPGLRWVGASCRSLVARLAAGGGAQSFASAPSRPNEPSSERTVTLTDVQAVVLAGGHARLPVVERILSEELGRPVIRLADPDLAAVRGGIRFAGAAPTRRIPAEHPRWRVEPFAWEVPTGRARLERWSVAVGETYRRGAVLAQVRTADERVYELAAPDEGVLLTRQGRVGDVVGPLLVAASKRPASLLAGDPPGKRQELSGTGEWLFTPDRRVLVECAPAADAVRVWSFPDGALLREFHPGYDGAAGQRGRVFVHPTGRLTLVAWDRAGTFSVWDVRTGDRTSTFRDPSQPTRVLVNEREWRLSTEGEDSGSVGRYRRSIVTVWDLATGQRLEKRTDDGQRRLAGYGNRSASDCFGEAASSPDGQLRAVPVVTAAGSTGVSLRVAVSEQEVFRCEHSLCSRVRVAFSADGQFLLTARESPQDSHVDVWEL